MTDENLLNKVRKLLNLADPTRGGTEHERDTAMKMAQKLMFEHDLKLEELVEKQDDPLAGIAHDNSFLYDKRSTQWQGMLLHYIGMPFGCKLVYSGDPKRRRWTIIGTPDNIEAVKVLHEALVPWLKSQASIARREAMPSNPNAFNRAFFDMAGRTISSRLTQQRDYLANSHTMGTELVLRRSARNEDYAARLFGQLRKNKSRGRGYSNEQGQSHGYNAGQRADLTPKKLT